MVFNSAMAIRRGHFRPFPFQPFDIPYKMSDRIGLLPCNGNSCLPKVPIYFGKNDSL
jgi:hypothetical protein